MSDTAFEPKPLVPALDFDNRMIPAHGTTSVDFEERVDYKRLRAYRLARAVKSLEATECGAFLLFDFYNIRYTTQTWVGWSSWRQDVSLRASDARRQATHLGLWFRCKAPPAFRTLDRARSLSRWNAGAKRRNPPRGWTNEGRGQDHQGHACRCWC